MDGRLRLRAKHATLVHADSSRSHLIITVTLTTAPSWDSPGEWPLVPGQWHIIESMSKGKGSAPAGSEASHRPQGWGLHPHPWRIQNPNPGGCRAPRQRREEIGCGREENALSNKTQHRKTTGHICHEEYAAFIINDSINVISV